MQVLVGEMTGISEEQQTVTKKASSIEKAVKAVEVDVGQLKALGNRVDSLDKSIGAGTTSKEMEDLKSRVETVEINYKSTEDFEKLEGRMEGVEKSITALAGGKDVKRLDGRID